MTASGKRLLVYATLAAALVVGAYLRLTSIAERPLWYDEAFTWHVAVPQTYGDWLLWQSREPNHPPLSFIAASLAMEALRSDAEWVLRLPSVICAIALLPSMFVLGFLVRGPGAGALAAALAALAPNMIDQGQQGRMYAMLALVVVWALGLCVRLLQGLRAGQDDGLVPWAALGVLLGAAVWTNQLGVALVAGVLAGLPLAAVTEPSLRGRERRARLLLRTATCAAVALVVVSPGLGRLLSDVGRETTAGGVPISVLGIARDVGETFVRLVGNPWGAAAAGLLAATGLATIVRRDRAVAGVLLLVVLAGILLLFPLRQRHPFLAVRFLSAVEPVVWIAVAAGATAAFGRARYAGLVSAAVVVVSLAATSADLVDWRSRGRYVYPLAVIGVAERVAEEEMVLFHPSFNRILGHYYGLPRYVPLQVALWKDPFVERKETLAETARPPALWFVGGFTAKSALGEGRFEEQLAEIRALARWYGHEARGEEIARQLRLGDVYVVRFDAAGIGLELEHRSTDP